MSISNEALRKVSVRPPAASVLTRPAPRRHRAKVDPVEPADGDRQGPDRGQVARGPAAAAHLQGARGLAGGHAGL
jgi:hypothetical protein